MDSLVFNVAVGAAFMFATFALLASRLTEGVTRFLGLRGEYLLRGIRLLVDGKSIFTIPDLREWGAFFGRTPKKPDPQAVNPNITKMLEGSFGGLRRQGQNAG